MKMLNKDKTDCLIIRNMHSGIKENEIIENNNKAEKKLEESIKINKLLILKLNNFFITEIKYYKNDKKYKKEINKIEGENKKIIFIITEQRFNSKQKVTTLLSEYDEINKIFIDNINGSKLSIEDIEGKKKRII